MALGCTDLELALRGRAILSNVSISLMPGEVTVILGANGAGKSSLLACLAGLRAPTSGAVLLDGRPLAAIPERKRARLIGLLPQSAEVHWDIDARALVALGRWPRRGRWGETDADRAAISSAMVATDVAHLAQRRVQRLSGGERARVLLARVLAGEPRWLLADEPLASLDPAHQLDVLDALVASARAGIGVVVVLHDLTQAARIADHVIVMQAGRVLAAGPRDAVLTPELIRAAFGVEVMIDRDRAGAPLIIATGRR